MEVILVKDVENLGMRNEVVKVKTGFARNYLLPKRLAIPATKGNLEGLKHKIQVAVALREKRMDEARTRAEQLGELVIAVRKKTGKEGRLFGSVTAQEVAELLQVKAGFPVERRKLSLPEHIKAIGTYQFQLKLEQGIVATIRLEVKPDEESLKEAAAAPKAPPAPAPEAPAEEPAPEPEAGDDEDDEDA